MKKFLYSISLVLLLFNGSSAIFGSLMLMKYPDGSKFEMPVSQLAASPFEDYTIPGIILFTFIGISSIIVLLLSLMKLKYFTMLILLQGVVLCIWIGVQYVMIRAFHPLQAVYAVIGISLFICGYFLNKKAVPE